MKFIIITFFFILTLKSEDLITAIRLVQIFHFAICAAYKCAVCIVGGKMGSLPAICVLINQCRTQSCHRKSHLNFYRVQIMLPRRSQGQGQSWLSAMVLDFICSLKSYMNFQIKHRLNCTSIANLYTYIIKL